MQELQPPEDGLFLVRESVRHPGDYVLCVSFGKEVIHYRVVHEENTLSIDSQQYFSNLIDMIEVRSPGRESHQCQRRARTSWAGTEQWQVPLSLSCSVWFSLVFVTWCNYLHQRLMVPTSLECNGQIWDIPRMSLQTSCATCSPHPHSRATSLSLLIQCFTQQEDPGGLCLPWTLRHFTVSPSTQSPLSPADPTGLPGCCMSSCASSGFFLVVHPHPVSSPGSCTLMFSF